MDYEFTTQEWLDTEKELNFQIDPAVEEQIKELGLKISKLCQENDIPFILSFVGGGTPEAFQLRSLVYLQPLRRLPAELLSYYIMGAEGLVRGCEFGIGVANYEPRGEDVKRTH